ncbi:MAG: ATP-binding protein [Bernardetiaceae bacterium]|nr:ATP-binding protein [Bernardetiaceae bacterium]
MENPFADYGKIVKGKRFVGRKKQIESIRNRVLGSSFGNIAIQGLPRIGKSSLAWNAIMEDKVALERSGIIPIRINVGSIDNSDSFFIKLIKELHRCIKRLNSSSLTYFQDIFDKINQASRVNDRNDFIEEYYIVLRENKMRVIYILDEFDAVKSYLNVADFQFLRELTYHPDMEVCLITTSRQTLKEIEPEEGTLSNFYQTFTDINLTMFDDNDITNYWERVDCLFEISDEYKKEVYHLVANHPYWLDMINYYVFNKVKQGDRISFDLLLEIEGELKKILWDNYDDIISLMDKEGIKSHFIQAVIGPVLNLTQMSIERLIKYGLVTPVLAREKYGTYFQALVDAGLASENDISYNSISNHLNDYLKQKETEFDIWALWNETEHQVRSLITVQLKEKYGEYWQDAFISANPKKENEILQMESLRAKNKKSFGNLGSENLVNYTYPLDMWNCFISTDWTWFQRVLKGDLKTWRDKFKFLATIRNPIAHSNKDFVLQDEQTKAKEICNELIENIKNWEVEYRD